MKIAQIIVFLLIFSTNLFAQSIALPSIETEQKIVSGVVMYRDESNRASIWEVRQKQFVLSEKSVPDFNWGKFTGWIKIEVASQANQNLVLQVHNPLFEEIRLYVFEGENLVIDGQTFSNFHQQPQEYRYPNFEINFKNNQKYEIYLAAQAKLNPIKFPIRLLSKKGLRKLENRTATEFGFMIGFSVLVVFLNALIGLVFRVRVFWILSLFGCSFIVLYLYLEGFLFSENTFFLFNNTVFNPQYLIYYFLNYLSFATVWALYRVHLSSQFVWRQAYSTILVLIFLAFGFTFLSPLWYDSVSSRFLMAVAFFVRVIPLTSQVFMIAASIRLLKTAPISKWYLAAVIPSILSYAIPRFFSDILSDLWVTLPQVYFIAMIVYVLILSSGFIIYLSKNYHKSIEKYVPKITQDIDNKTVIEHNEVLSKRELEILKAFANGFTYNEISDAMFISPHTVRTHLKNIYQKLGINSKAEAIRYVMERQKF